MKVFDCQAMPQDVRTAFFECERDKGAGNDCYVTWYYLNDTLEGEGFTNDFVYRAALINNWLLENGAVVEDDEVLIKHWW